MERNLFIVRADDLIRVEDDPIDRFVEDLEVAAARAHMLALHERGEFVVVQLGEDIEELAA